jgi:predicted NUDIX family NTP pyrophosphohydrolase
VAKQSAGIVLYRERSGALEVLLVHPGGPLWEKKEEWPPRSGITREFPEVDRA